MKIVQKTNSVAERSTWKIDIWARASILLPNQSTWIVGYWEGGYKRPISKWIKYWTLSQMWSAYRSGSQSWGWSPVSVFFAPVA